jgi:hypothetical protein
MVDLSTFLPVHINTTTIAGRSMLIVSLKKSSHSARNKQTNCTATNKQTGRNSKPCNSQLKSVQHTREAQ